MINIVSGSTLETVLASPIDAALKRLLALRRSQLLSDTDGSYDLGDLVQMIVVEPGDNTKMIESAAGYPFILSPIFEWAAYQDGWFEAVTILSDDGFGIDLFVPDDARIDGGLLSLMRQQAELSNLPET